MQYNKYEHVKEGYITDASVICTVSTFTVQWLHYGNILCYVINNMDLQISNKKYIK
jgi:hypothetical protein